MRGRTSGILSVVEEREKSLCDDELCGWIGPNPTLLVYTRGKLTACDGFHQQLNGCIFPCKVFFLIKQANSLFYYKDFGERVRAHNYLEIFVLICLLTIFGQQYNVQVLHHRKKVFLLKRLDRGPLI